MRNKNVRILITVSSTLALFSIVFFYHFFNTWMSSIDEQKTLQKDQIHILNKQFENKVLLSLTYVRDRILKSQGVQSYSSLEPVNMVDPNYYLVPVPDTVDMGLIKEVLAQEFNSELIEDDYILALYDCFDNSYIDRSSNIEGLSAKYELTPYNWLDYEGHYFAVYFPERMAQITDLNKDELNYMSLGFILIFILILILFIYNLIVIFKQKRISEIKNDFINNMTHELKTPIATISLSSEMIKNPKVLALPDKVKHYAQVIFDENRRLKMVVDRVLNIAKLEKGDIQLEFEKVHYHDIIKNAIYSCQIKTNESFQYDCLLEADNDQVLGDKVHLENIINNLLDNAIKYAKDKPKVTLKSYNDNNNLVIVLEDEGIGIDSRHLKYIFEKFYRVPTGNVHNVKGFGLGLFYVKQMIDKHSGKITISSKINEGTRITLQLPLYN